MGCRKKHFHLTKEKQQAYFIATYLNTIHLSFSGRSPFVAIFAIYLFQIKANVVRQFRGAFWGGEGEGRYSVIRCPDDRRVRVWLIFHEGRCIISTTTEKH